MRGCKAHINFVISWKNFPYIHLQYVQMYVSSQKDVKILESIAYFYIKKQ
jgi:hypothetical protein